MKKSLKCKLGFHDWVIIEEKTYGILMSFPITLEDKICIRPGCGKRENQFEEYAKLEEEQNDRIDRANNILKDKPNESR